MLEDFYLLVRRARASVLLIVGLIIGTGVGYYGAISRFNSSITGYEVEISSLEVDLADLTYSVGELEKEIESKDAQISTLESQIEENEIEILGLINEITEFNEDVSRLSTQVSKYQNHISDLSTEYEATIALLQYQNEQLQDANEQLQAQINESNNYSNMTLGEIGGVHYIWWDFPKSRIYTTLTVRVTINEELEFNDGMYFQMYQSHINNQGFYFGFQTRTYHPELGDMGKGIIFSRWETRSLDNVKISENGWAQSAGYEGDFVGVRRNYDWGIGTYTFTLSKNQTDDNGDWYDLFVTDEIKNSTDYCGSIRFQHDVKEGISYTGATWTEIYMKENIDTPIPRWNVSITDISMNNDLDPVSVYVTYSDIIYTEIHVEKGKISFLMGKNVERKTPTSYVTDIYLGT